MVIVTKSSIVQLRMQEGCKEREPNSAAALASQPAAGHSLSFISIIVFMTLGWGL